MLNLKPVLQIQGEKLDAFSKARGWKTAKKTMLNAIEKDLNERFADVKDQMVLGMAYTCSKEEAQEWKAEIEERFPGYEIMEGSLSLSVVSPYWSGGTGDYLYEEIVIGNCDEMRSILEVGSEQLHNLYW